MWVLTQTMSVGCIFLRFEFLNTTKRDFQQGDSDSHLNYFDCTSREYFCLAIRGNEITLSSGDFSVDQFDAPDCQVDEVPNLKRDAKKVTPEGDGRAACALSLCTPPDIGGQF